MAWKIHIDPDVYCSFIKFYGAFEFEQIIGAAGDMFSHPDYRAGMNILRDSREQHLLADVSFKSLSVEAKKMMELFDDKLGPSKLAIVVGNAQSYAKIHQYIVAGRLSKSPIERKAFRDIEKAKKWLGLPVGYEIKEPSLRKAA